MRALTALACSDALRPPTARLETRTKESSVCASVKLYVWLNSSQRLLLALECTTRELVWMAVERRIVKARIVSGRTKYAAAKCRSVRLAAATGPSSRYWDRDLSASADSGTRKVVIYTLRRRSRGKPWWKPVAVLTCKSFVRAGRRGERLIELPSSWFSSKFPSG